MDKRDESGPEARRRFLKSMAVTGGGVVAAVATMGQSAAAAEVEAQPAGAQPEGYHVTQHIRDYYAKAQF